MKKLRALLRLAKPHLPARVHDRLRSKIRRVKNAFASSRDAEVMQKLVAKIMRRRHLPSPARSAAASPALSSTRTASIRAVQRSVITLRRELAALRLENLTADALIAGYARRYRACRRAWKQCEKKLEPELFHRWRKPVKELHYLSLVLHSLPGANECIDPTRKIGRWLGQEHDLTLLDARIIGRSAKEWHRVINKQINQLHRRIFKVSKDVFARSRRQVQHKLEREMS